MRVCFTAVALAIAALAPAADTADPKTPAGFTPLFNGKNLDGWKGHTTMKERATLRPRNSPSCRSSGPRPHWSTGRSSTARSTATARAASAW